MSATTTYETVILGFGKHASIEIPAENVAELGGSKRSPLRITINGYTYQSTATAVDGTCMVVFPTKDRLAAGVDSGDHVTVTMELESGYREVDMPGALVDALKSHGLTQVFHDQNYSTRKEFARLVTEAKADATKARRIDKIIAELKD